MSTRTDLAPARQTLGQLRKLIQDHPRLKVRFDAAKEVVRAFRRPGFYEVSQRCNLFCEGCYYFEGPTAFRLRKSPDVETWRAFFEREARERKVSMAYFIGAEPSLEQERLFAASEYFEHGNIGTNGTVKIDPAIPFRVSISAWGDEETDRRLRGANALRKALANYGGDPRAIVVYTLSAWNLDAAREVTVMCRDHGLPITFNMYTSTVPFAEKAAQDQEHDKAYFRLSSKDHTPAFDEASLDRCRAIVSDLMQEFPETVVYTKAYNDWVTQHGSIFEIDPETGIAPECGSRIVGNMKYFGADLNAHEVKCPTPDINCAECRMYSAGWSTRLKLFDKDVTSAGAFDDWCDIIEALGEIFVLPRERARLAASTKEAKPALATA